MFELLSRIVALDPTGLLDQGLQSIQSQFGAPGVIAALILGLSVGTLVMVKLLKIAFDILRYVVIPSMAVTLIATCFLPYTFANILPVAVALFSVILIVKA